MLNSSTSDRIDAIFAARRSRRDALKAGAVAAGAAGAVRFGTALAQDGSPVAADPATGKTMYLFVQAFEGGTWAPNDDGTFTLTVSGGVASTIYFSDRPERVFGASPTQLFLDNLGFRPDNPPNAAIVVNDHGVEDIVVVELTDPAYDAAAGTLSYTVRVLEAYDGDGLGDAVARKPGDNDLPAEFSEGALFIDDCPDQSVMCCCTWDCEITGDFPALAAMSNFCYSYPSCWPCQYTSADCNARFPEYNGDCSIRSGGL